MAQAAPRHARWGTRWRPAAAPPLSAQPSPTHLERAALLRVLTLQALTLARKLLLCCLGLADLCAQAREGGACQQARVARSNEASARPAGQSFTGFSHGASTRTWVSLTASSARRRSTSSLAALNRTAASCLNLSWSAWKGGKRSVVTYACSNKRARPQSSMWHVGRRSCQRAHLHRLERLLARARQHLKLLGVAGGRGRRLLRRAQLLTQQLDLGSQLGLAPGGSGGRAQRGSAGRAASAR